MTTELGKREAHKVATRRAIQQAADALFGTQGFTSTTVRQIADAAGVTERTFFRYFPSKEALLVEDIQTWLPTLGDAIRRRPAGESPLDAIENSVLSLGKDLWSTARPNLTWLFHNGPPASRLATSAPGLLLQFEQVIADALGSRGGDSGTDDVFAHQVLARAAVAALRSAGIREWQLRVADAADGPTLADLVRRAFAILRQR